MRLRPYVLKVSCSRQPRPYRSIIWSHSIWTSLPNTSAPPPSRSRLLVPIIWTAYIAIPVSGWGWLDGVPLRPLEAAAVAFIWWVWAARRTLPGTRTLAVLAVMKILLGAVLVDRGFDARYYANDSWAAPMERSTEYRTAPFTRRDARLRFGVGPPDLPLYFFNDHRRFNFYRPSDPQRQLLGYSATWTGFLRVDRPITTTFYMAAADAASGGLSVDGREVVTIDPGSDRSGSATLDTGWHELRVSI